jgi:hypothetical protein
LEAVQRWQDPVSGKATLNNGIEGVAGLVNSSGLPVTVTLSFSMTVLACTALIDNESICTECRLPFMTLVHPSHKSG